MVGHHRNVRLAFEDLRGEHRQRSLWTDLDEGTRTGSRHGLDLSGPLDR